MTAEQTIRAALAAGPTPGRWMHLPGDRFVYDRMEDGCRGLPVVGVDYSPAFFDQPAKNLDYIAACNPANVAELLAELDRLRAERKPLPIERINALSPGPWPMSLANRVIKLIRDVEAEHGITGD